MTDWNKPNWWDDMLMSNWTNEEITRHVMASKREKSERPMLAPESYDFIILISGNP